MAKIYNDFCGLSEGLRRETEKQWKQINEEIIKEQLVLRQDAAFLCTTFL